MRFTQVSTNLSDSGDNLFYEYVLYLRLGREGGAENAIGTAVALFARVYSEESAEFCLVAHFILLGIEPRRTDMRRTRYQYLNHRAYRLKFRIGKLVVLRMIPSARYEKWLTAELHFGRNTVDHSVLVFECKKQLVDYSNQNLTLISVTLGLLF